MESPVRVPTETSVLSAAGVSELVKAAAQDHAVASLTAKHVSVADWDRTSVL